MPLRDKFKRAFGRSPSTTDPSLPTSNKQSKTRKASSNVYQPGEPMPKPKYRAPVDAKHKEKLDSFTFADNFRRKSIQSLYSPMGSRLPSRNNSLTGGRPKFSRGQSHVGRLVENAADDTETANVGGSRRHSRDNFNATVTAADFAAGSKTPASHNENAENQDPAPRGPKIIVTGNTADDHTPFSEQDLNLALNKSASRVTAGGA